MQRTQKTEDYPSMSVLSSREAVLLCTYDMQNVWESYQRWFAFLRLY